MLLPNLPLTLLNLPLSYLTYDVVPTPVVPTRPIVVYAGGQPLSVVTAAGPFTTSDNLDYQVGTHPTPPHIPARPLPPARH